jgi:hypothetical protein
LFWRSLIFQILWSFPFVSDGTLVACAGVVFSSGAADVSAGGWGILVGPHVLSTSGAEVLCSSGGLFLTGVAVLSAIGKDAQAREETGLITGMSGHGGDTSFSTWGVVLKLEACSGTRGALRKKSKL